MVDAKAIAVSHRFQDILSGRNTLKFGIPWLTPNSILELEKFLKPEHAVLEFGSGGSTLFFSRKCHRVVSYESNAGWYQKMKGRVGNNVEMSMNLKQCLAAKGPFDVVLVDSHGPTTDRIKISIASLFKVSPGGRFVLDNYSRYNLSFLNGWLIRRYDFPGWDGKGTLIASKL